MEQGLLLKGIGGFYTVQTADGSLVQCKARGKFRKDGVSPMVGDRVQFERQREGHALLMEILPRSNTLVRPPVANITQLIIVLANGAPKPDLLLCDKLILQARLIGIAPVIVVNKYDMADDLAQTIFEDYRRWFPVLLTSTQTGEGMDALSQVLCGEISCFAGQSAVGKSSLLNVLLPELHLEVGGLAKRTDRGRHTTRHAQLWPYRGGAVLDTPGFSLFDLEAPTQEALDACYPEFGDAPSRCRFTSCVHVNEPDCAVKALLLDGSLSPGRYARYVQLATYFNELRKHRYD